MNKCVWSSLIRGPGVFGEVRVQWNILPALVAVFTNISGSVTMKDQQSFASFILKVRANVECDIIFFSGEENHLTHRQYGDLCAFCCHPRLWMMPFLRNVAIFN